MPAPEDDFPLALRDELFKLFTSRLGSAQAEKRFQDGVTAISARIAGSWVKAAYLDDRAPRYLEALRQTAALDAAAAPFARPVQIARILFNQGLFFDAHECLEPAWKLAQGREKDVLQGLIQAGAGMHKLELGSSEGCAELLKNAAAKLAEAQGAGLKAFGQALEALAPRAQRDELKPEDAPQLAASALEL